MKVIILLGDGMSDETYEQLGNKSPLQAAQTPNMDFMARHGQVGLASTVPAGLPPGSDVANLSVFGYDPRSCYTGRSPLEAVSMGVELGPEDVAFRMNLVTLKPHGTKLYMEDFSAGHISTAEGRELVETLQKEIGSKEIEFHAGVGYRHLMVWRGGKDGMKSTPPHDITGKSVLEYLPSGEGAERLNEIMNHAQMVLHGHPLNKQRKDAHKLPANSVWLWGHGKTPRIDSYQEKFGLKGAVISAVDLIKGIGLCAGLDSIAVVGATGYIDTNYLGKAQAALAALETHDFVYVHVEAPDEASHSGRMDHKLQAIEDFDRQVVGTVLEGIKRFGDYAILCTPDHPTPVRLMTHTAEAVPFVIYRGGSGAGNGAASYDEQQAHATGLAVEGHTLMEMLLKN
ncbi:cofactor-independent phosphoglycerate mutase [Geobacter sp. SVR]|uniref:cofactor-independent phosphoglycerate mutase n=1 Tax=Geobacter sp. SVR TaxID=2495594 RepID=UPI00143EF523|nr:cofactor-independent phosphoglycerate mutase [Geobacter sp. SVR]BCS53159.1 putative 2,3-bisphosphoglycerate-independent phosphoglycerate mutase [Geobacter sp. SVR]GCF84544.1 putative 2,3-bisphosphoglycerate-independent phosphoglycerate mutase [Geobacter sp. SVR]